MTAIQTDATGTNPSAPPPAGSPGAHPAPLNLTLKVWRQKGPADPGGFEVFEAEGISPDMSFLEMLDIVNERLTVDGKEPIAFDHDCREGICGTCSLMIDGIPHGPQRGTATCQLHMRHFHDGQEIVIEPWRATAFPVLKDLIVDRSPLDRIIEAGGFITVNTGSAPDANLTPVPKPVADTAFDAAACIGCGACVAACPNGAAQLFTAAKVTHLNLLPQGQAERYSRVEAMVDTMEQYFGSCTNHGECQAACPKEIPIDFIATMNKDYLRAKLKNRRYLSRKS
jgi:succinate dehydrogenase / fumarate reductase iron-sulfur subunit